MQAMDRCIVGYITAHALQVLHSLGCGQPKAPPMRAAPRALAPRATVLVLQQPRPAGMYFMLLVPAKMAESVPSPSQEFQVGLLVE